MNSSAAATTPTAPTEATVPTDARRNSPARPIRYWPALLIIALGGGVFAGLAAAPDSALARALAAVFRFDDPTLMRLFAVIVMPALVGLLLAIWWVFFSRARGAQLWGALIAAAALAIVALLLGDRFGKMFAVLWGVPATGAAAIVWSWLSRSWRESTREIGLGAVAALAFLPWLCVRSNGQVGDGMVSFSPRWKPLPDTALAGPPSAAKSAVKHVATTSQPASPGDWPGFRGKDRNSLVAAAAPPTTAAPREVWRRKVGLGWSSFTVIGNVFYTQEQRGNQECVVAYDLATGSEKWIHGDKNRFDEMAGGAGPRSTPTYADGRLFTFGPSGIINCLDAADGAVLWSKRDFAEKTPPMWGFAAAPLVVDGLVVIGLCGVGGVRLAAFDGATGANAWRVAGGRDGYSSPQLATLHGVRQILYLDGLGLTSHEVASGKELWRYDWPGNEPKVPTPIALDDRSVLVGMGYGRGMRRIDVLHDSGKWSAAERWASIKLKPKFNDFVVYQDHIYGLDEGVLTCISAGTGERKWKGGKYGYGQVLLTPPNLLISTEGKDGDSNEIVIVPASPDEPREVLKFPAVTGKTWNHPVWAHDRLLVRNGSEMVCFAWDRAN